MASTPAPTAWNTARARVLSKGEHLRTWVCLGFAFGLLACGSTSDDGGAATGGATAGGAGGTGGGAAGGGAGGAGGIAPLTPDPGQLKCGTEVCNVPGQICCHESAGGGVDRCVASLTDCKAPNRACDETGDCASGEICCTGTAVLPAGSALGGFAATRCVDKNAPVNCLPQAGVGKSSVQACKTDVECAAKTCIAEACYGYPLMTCGGSGDCK